LSSQAPADDPLVARLRAVDSPALSDACDQLGLSPAVITHLRAVAASRRIAGRVVTVSLGTRDGTVPTRHLGTAAIDASGADHVVVVAHEGRTECAGWGGTLSRAAAARGIAGTIVDGAVRDVDEANELGYPVIASAVTPRTARGRVVEIAWNESISIAGQRIDPGDYVMADASGIIVIAAAHIADVLTRAELAVAREAAMAAEIDAGTPVSEVMGASYERASLA
jgi:4-hydroxy-4-methyl-2-oxoglutarate aldolase